MLLALRCAPFVATVHTPAAYERVMMRRYCQLIRATPLMLLMLFRYGDDGRQRLPMPIFFHVLRRYATICCMLTPPCAASYVYYAMTYARRVIFSIYATLMLVYHLTRRDDA